MNGPIEIYSKFTKTVSKQILLIQSFKVFRNSAETLSDNEASVTLGAYKNKTLKNFVKLVANNSKEVTSTYILKDINCKVYRVRHHILTVPTVNTNARKIYNYNSYLYIHPISIQLLCFYMNTSTYIYISVVLYH